MGALGFSLVLPLVLCDLTKDSSSSGPQFLYLENERVGPDQRVSCCASESPGGTLKKYKCC